MFPLPFRQCTSRGGGSAWPAAAAVRPPCKCKTRITSPAVDALHCFQLFFSTLYCYFHFEQNAAMSAKWAMYKFSSSHGLRRIAPFTSKHAKESVIFTPFHCATLFCITALFCIAAGFASVCPSFEKARQLHRSWGAGGSAGRARLSSRQTV